ncbi:hypothetical protein TSUD_383530 [Trifolium subterraneum]|uniref:Uncharacterized protein n=1 Tax=Trifolium subterraneum TaxID=3900 RepID=A0A2Z6NYE1_TRISU|nr:hypothetical protein TSUD_383530 [Trifolium subterraneum]
MRTAAFEKIIGTYIVSPMCSKASVFSKAVSSFPLETHVMLKVAVNVTIRAKLLPSKDPPANIPTTFTSNSTWTLVQVESEVNVVGMFAGGSLLGRSFALMVT